MDILKRVHSFSFYLFILITFISIKSTWASDDMSSAREILKNVAEEMCAEINQNREEIKSDPYLLKILIEKTLEPNFSVEYASRRAVAVKDWKNTSQANRQDFTRAFRGVLLNFYSTGLREYLNSSDEDLDAKMMSFSAPVRIYENRIFIKSSVSGKGRSPREVTYKMIWEKERWKIYDIALDGQYVLKLYKADFKEKRKSHKFPWLIDYLEAKTEKILATRK
ncbi:hypothetical protein MNBD_GAMMA25-2038 [hydrothermal vent metagenome]|uniref:ABC transporter substrate-binding protein n=1 Tax=hydrothermal vent metagenome TaxID=652676 RepID=A0A3B1BFQ7_9ZZZZ